MSAFVSLTPINDLDQPSIKFVLETNNEMPREKKVKDISLSGLLKWQIKDFCCKFNIVHKSILSYFSGIDFLMKNYNQLSIIDINSDINCESYVNFILNKFKGL